MAVAGGGSATHAPVVVGTPHPPFYHRVESPTQTRNDAQLQVSSMEVWGKPAQGSNIPSVKAYRAALPARRGIGFCTQISPTPGTGTPYEARWYPGTPGVLARPNGHAGIPITYIQSRIKEHSGALMFQQIPLEELAGTELLPQAIIARPISYFSDALGIQISKSVDDFDEFEGAALRLNGNLPFALKHYAGHPDETTTIYLPYTINNVAQITAIIRRIAEELHIARIWIAWQRMDDPNL